MEVSSTKVMTKKKNIFLVAGVISTILGIVGAIPSFLTTQYATAVASTFLIVGGLVLIAIAFEE